MQYVPADAYMLQSGCDSSLEQLEGLHLGAPP
jgi:hypothetical protein